VPLNAYGFTPGLDDTTASVVGDLNGDGAMDLVLTNSGSATVSVSIGWPRRLPWSTTNAWSVAQVFGRSSLR
jgi:hypothetical protein